MAAIRFHLQTNDEVTRTTIKQKSHSRIVRVINFLAEGLLPVLRIIRRVLEIFWTQTERVKAKLCIQYSI